MGPTSLIAGSTVTRRAPMDNDLYVLCGQNWEDFGGFQALGTNPESPKADAADEAVYFVVAMLLNRPVATHERDRRDHRNVGADSRGREGRVSRGAVTQAQVDYEEDKGPVKPPRGIDFRGMAAAIISGDYEEVERVAPE